MLSGNSTAVTVPPEWLQQNGLKAGEEVMMVMNGKLIFMPINQETIQEVSSLLSYTSTGSKALDKEMVAPS